MKLSTVQSALRSTRSLCTILGLSVAFFLVPSKAHAYFDPASGGVILTALGGLFVGTILTLNLWWTKVKIFVLRLLGKKSDPAQAPASSEVED